MTDNARPRSKPSWDDRYRSGDPLPWDTGRPDPHLITALDVRGISPGRTLEVGCGKGHNTVWLAERGHDVLGVDLSADAIDSARAKAAASAAASHCAFAVLDFLREDVPRSPFALVFDRGCFHAFDEPDDQARFAERVAALLDHGGLWLSVIGSTEGPARDHGPPRRSLRDVASAIEPHLELIELRSVHFDAALPTHTRGWLCLSRKRSVAPQPSTHRG